MSGGTYHAKNGDVFEMRCDIIDVTSMSRVDTSWRFVDPAGHEHRWYETWDKCKACEAGYRRVADGMHYNDAAGGVTWGVCRKLTPFPAKSYSPSKHYITPTLVWVHDGWSAYEDGEPYELAHQECKDCGATVKPGTCADTYKQHVAGLKHYRINGEPVGEDEFKRRVAEASR